MVSINSKMYHAVKRKNQIFYIANDVASSVDFEKDSENILMQMSDFVLTLTKTKSSAFGEWLVSKGGNNEL